MISVVVVDDDQLVRSGVKMILGTAPDIDVIGEASDGDEAIRLVSRVRPDVVLMDVRMPGTDGIEATRKLAAAIPGCRIAILTTFEHDEYVFDALRAGASGFLLKRIPPDDLIAAVRTLAVRRCPAIPIGHQTPHRGFRQADNRQGLFQRAGKTHR